MRLRKIMFIGGTFYISLYKQDMKDYGLIKNDLVDIEDIIKDVKKVKRKRRKWKRNTKGMN